MFNNITFIGGIHGVGKTTICQQICNEVKLEYLSSSELIKWNDINLDAKNKKIHNISINQDRLISGLSNKIQKNKSYILDGHYCLLNWGNKIENIPIKTFELINPFSLNIVLGDVIEIKNRLEKRDNCHYDQNLLRRMQECELNYAKYLSKTMKINLNIGTLNDFSELLNSLRIYMSSAK